MEAKFLGDHCNRLATGQSVLYRFGFERGIKFAPDIDGDFFDEFHVIRFAQFSVFQFEATSVCPLPTNPT